MKWVIGVVVLLLIVFAWVWFKKGGIAGFRSIMEKKPAQDKNEEYYDEIDDLINSIYMKQLAYL